MFIRIGSYIWTQHVKQKMKFYGLSEARVKRVVRFPERIEEGIAPNTVACMQKTTNIKKPQEVWAMYQVRNKNVIKIISAWKYPGVSPKNNPIPQDILDELKNMLD